MAEDNTHQSWDAFWSEVSNSRARTETIRGVTIQVPTDLPLAFETRYDELRESSRREDIAELLELLFGADVLDEWEQAGMGLLELQTVLAWSVAQAAGRDLSFAEAYELVRDGDEGKAPQPGLNRAARRRQSASTGGRSKRTSSASTGSARKKSRH